MSGEGHRGAAPSMQRHTAAILFDIDGTLISTGGAGNAAWRHAFEELHGVAADIQEFTKPGMTDPEVARLTFEGALGREPHGRELGRLIARYLHYLTETIERSKGYRTMEGVEELVPRLVNDGYLLGLTTGNLEAAAHIKLARPNLNRFFSCGGYGSDSAQRRELTAKAVERAALVSGGRLQRDACVAIGDTPLDIEAGHGAGIRVIGVGTGDYAPDELLAAGADAALESLREPLPV